MGNSISVPYSSFVENGVAIGSRVNIEGFAKVDYESFSINLCVMPTKNGGDVALHFNPRYNNEKAIVRNYKMGGVWGQEERDGNYILTRGSRFELEIKVHQHGYKVMLNKRYGYDFTHHIPREYVQYLHIEGDVKIAYITYKPGPVKNNPPATPYQPMLYGGGAPPMYPPGGAPPIYPPGGAPPMYPPGAAPPMYLGYPTAPGYPQAAGYPGYPAQPGPIFNPAVPANIPIPGVFAPGKMIYITGVPSVTASRFMINLACGSSDSSDLALHFDVRFKHGTDQNIVVRTSREKGKFGKEERQHSAFPFKRGEMFEMILMGELNCIKVAVNSQHFIQFDHRIQPVQRADHVQVRGDIAVPHIRFH
ncbi:hypothetical protein RRG08_012685 [Elysia crispata]|uniref:Galectin n=1 Tax=Elysia crispata TaxID=231223 RepID=A0AAE0YMY0_9GAST|nr:hypothetical protein RRG08_012685 [Elysia crispata]